MHHPTAPLSTSIRNIVRQHIHVFLLFLMLGSCIGGYTGRHIPGRYALQRQRAQWAQQHLTDYRYDVILECLCPYELVRVDVHHGQVTATPQLANGTPVVAPRAVEFAPMENMFNLIENDMNHGVYRITVQYHPTYGYPQVIDVVFHGYGNDDSSTVRIEHFERTD